ncbi:hypothetical protein CALCODRAFT_426161 [Calocera cornea HHB12733]|uniref:Pre-mRNA-splicing factor CWC26 n=1 Tax=Calocera cornea HHB12733 TaxID=1353952 RepID=A0A165JZ08_9BASI|nr:hypothetical protein CALCODRAFT_426161 [Calocera cornea HHB12733]
MASSLKAYLADKYMSGPKADAILAREAPRKKKRKHADPSASASGMSLIVEDDVAPWKAAAENMDEEDAPEFVEEAKSFRKKNGGGWQTIREPSPPDEKPQLVLPDGKPLPAPSISSARARPRSPSPAPESGNPEQETVYRDASGRKIDLSVARAEKKRKAREEAEKMEKQMQWGKGVVQREEADRRRRELEEERRKGFARTADDVELNSRLKDEERWDDPAAAFLTVSTQSGPKRPVYSGPPPPPNRFGILPGYRWDGVDRGNGFEKKLFQRQNEKQRTGLEAYQWSVDDM